MKNGREYKKEERRVEGQTLLEVVQDLIHEGSVRRITILDDKDRTLISFPILLGVPVAFLLPPTLAAVGAIAGLVSGCKLIIEREVEVETGVKS